MTRPAGSAHPAWSATCAVLAIFSCASCGATAAGAAERPVALVWHVEADDGKVLGSKESDRPVNPASVVKIATSLRALEKLGPDHRFTTRFGIVEEGAGAGSLVVVGGADPDFHFENAMLVANALRRSGITRLEGDLFVGEEFWMGWERGTAGREPDARKRREDMGRRLLEAWSPSRWDGDVKGSWREIASRRGWNADEPPSIEIQGRVRTDEPPRWRAVLVHRSEPLLVALRRFNVFSNNDIERLDASVGPPADLAAFLRSKWGEAATGASFATSSGLNRNRMTPRQVVRLLRDLRSFLAAKGHGPADVLPVLGCGQSTLPELFPRLRDSGEANGLTGKTGTLNLQDGGVSALAGFLPAGPGMLFFVAAPGAGSDLRSARAAEEDWVRRVLLARGAVGPLNCPDPVPTSDALAEVATPSAGT